MATPPAIPPKKNRKQSPDNSCEPSDGIAVEIMTTVEPGRDSPHLGAVDHSVSGEQAIRSLEDIVSEMMHSVADIKQITEHTATTEVQHEAAHDTMTASLPLLPSQVPKTSRPTPTPRASVRPKKFTEQNHETPTSRPQPLPRSLNKEHLTVDSVSTSHATATVSSVAPLNDMTAPTSTSSHMSGQSDLIEVEDVYEVMNSPETLDTPSTSDKTVAERSLPSTGHSNNCNTSDLTDSSLFSQSIISNTAADDAIYSNSDVTSSSTETVADIHGVPIPGSSANVNSIRPLTSEDLQLLDPTEYMSLWELESSHKTMATSAGDEIDNSCADSGEEVSSSKYSPKKVPPIPPRLNEYMDNVLPSMQELPTHKPSLLLRPKHEFATDDEFRNSYLIPLPDDPFADTSNESLFCFDNEAANEAANEADNDSNDRTDFCEANVYSLADNPYDSVVDDKKLVPSRAPPPKPQSAEHTSTGQPSIADNLYAEINKQPSPYSLADEIYPLDNGIDNPAVSYDSEDTIEEDSETDAPPVPVMNNLIPVSASPRQAQTDRHGYLYKQGGKQNNKGWRKRYVKFDGQRLCYFSNEKSRISKRIIPVQVMRCVENEVKDVDSNKFKFRLVTLNRVYLFAAETLDDHHFWTNILMQAIIMFSKSNGGGTVGKGMMRGGDMHTPDIEGYVRLDDSKKYVALKNGLICYYNNDNDFQFATPEHEISLETTSVKDIGKNRLQLTTPYHQYVLTLDNEMELENWKIATEDGIASALSDDNVLNEVYGNPSNRHCADCNSSKPHWAVLHLSTVVCGQCAGVHRQFWPFRVKSLRMDTKVWTKDLVALYYEHGNSTMNSVWEANIRQADKIISSVNTLARRTFIINKYLHRKYYTHEMNGLTDSSTPEQLSQGLLSSITNGNLDQVIFVVNIGAKTNKAAHGHPSVVQLAESCHHPVIAQFLRYNGAENETIDDIWSVMRKEKSCDETQIQPVRAGYLYKMYACKGQDYSQQWLAMSSTSLKFYETDTDTEAKVVIDCKSVVHLALHANDKHEPSFEIMTNQPGQGLYVYGADDWQTLNSWMSDIHKTITDGTGAHDLSVDFTKSGYVHCKRGSLGSWKWCWLQTKSKILHILDSDGSWREDVDLRKTIKLSLVHSDETTQTSPAVEKGPSLVVHMSDHYIYMQSDVRHETEAWYNLLDQACKEMSHNLEDQQLTRENVPVLIETCINFISLHGMTSEGIYRLSGTHSKVTTLLNELINGARDVYIRLDDYTVHDVANVLKRYLRNLQQPVMSPDLYGRWLSATNDSAHNKKLYTYKELLGQLPDVNYATLKLIIGHLTRVSEHEADNKMSSINLATVFGPVLLSGSSTGNATQQKFMNTSFEIQIVIELMQYYQWLFSVDQSEIEKERRINDAMEQIKIRCHVSAPVPSGEFMLGIHILNNLTDAVNMRVPAMKSASDIVKEVAQTKRIPRSDGYALYVVVCSGELERPLKHNEKVLDAMAIISKWNSDHRQGSYWCVKEDHIQECIDQAAGPDITRYTELQFSDKKGWKKMYFELNSTQLICYKDRSNNKLYEWSINDICLYMGVERKRRPPTIYGITLLCRSEEERNELSEDKSRPHLGRSICFHSDSEMYTWLAAIYYAQSLDTVPAIMNMSRSTSALSERRNLSTKMRLPSIKNPFKKST